MHKQIVHRDEIHGDVRYDELACALLNTDALQRLGRVYQLGYGHLVYRGGTHTRLSHSMGVYETAGQLVDALRRNYETQRKYPLGAVEPGEFLPCPNVSRHHGVADAQQDVAGNLRLDLENDPDTHSRPDAEPTLAARWSVLRHLVGWSGLLHDVAHVPLGHTLEDEFENIYRKHDDPRSPRLRFLWLGSDEGAVSEIVDVFRRAELYPPAFQELGLTTWQDVWGTVFLTCTSQARVGVRSLQFDPADDSAGGPGAADELRRLHHRLSPWLFAPYMTDIVANTISADYLDYLRRDPHNLGLDVLRDDRVVSQFWIGRDRAGQPHMALSLEDRRGKPRLDTCTGVVELVRQRFRFAEIVYYHKTKVAASAMLAKVFQLVGAPPELPQPRQLPALGETKSMVDGLLGAHGSARTTRLRELKNAVLPTALLDPEIGDESLPLFMLHRAWEQFEKGVKASDRASTGAAMDAITLLSALVRRSLYKTAVAFGFDLYTRLSGQGHTPETTVEEGLVALIGALRSDGSARAELEAHMVAATSDWPAHALLLYVPPRKSQAKGIETGALADGRVVTLGEHRAVSRDVKALSKRYTELWRLMVFVHPNYLGDVISLSAATDVLVGSSHLGGDPDHPEVQLAIKEACWFHYLTPKDRAAAASYRELLEHESAPVDWTLLDAYQSLAAGRIDGDELAAGAALLAELTSRSEIDLEEATRLAARYSQPHALAAEIDGLLAGVVEIRSREGGADAPEAVLARRAAIREIADRLFG